MSVVLASSPLGPTFESWWRTPFGFELGGRDFAEKVAGTEVGMKEPTATFSACFGGPFLVWHPSKYADLLAANAQA